MKRKTNSTNSTVVFAKFDKNRKRIKIGEETISFNELLDRVYNKKPPFEHGKFADDDERLLADYREDPFALDEVDALVADDYANSDADDSNPPAPSAR